MSVSPTSATAFVRPGPPRRVFVSVGERSGDVIGAQLMTELRRQDSSVYVFGWGGALMSAAGVAIDIDTTDIGVVGVTETIGTIPTVIRAASSIRRRIRSMPPDVALLIGNDLFNAVLARWLRRRGIPTLSYFPPQAWIWRSLARPLARGFDAIFTSFPYEYAVYARAGDRSEVTNVGHYLASNLKRATGADRLSARKALGLPSTATVIALLPGSRLQEWRLLLPVLLGAAELLLDRNCDTQFVIPVVDDRAAAATERALRRHSIGKNTVLCRESHVAMRSADIALMASGTACLEAALIGVPMVVVYKASVGTNLAARTAIVLGLIDSYTVSLPNLIMKRPVVPEFLQQNATIESVAREAAELLVDRARRAGMQNDYELIAKQLRGVDPLTDVAAAVLRWADVGRLRSAVAAQPGLATNRRIPAQEHE